MKMQNTKLDGLDYAWMEEQIRKHPMQMFSFLEGLFLPRFSVGQTGISRQELQYWRKNGLIESVEKNDTRSWVKVSFFEYCWLKLIAEMRDLFIPIEQIKKVKDALFSFDIEAFNERAKLSFAELKKSGDLNDELLELIQTSENEPELYKEAYKHYTVFIMILLELIVKNNPASLVIDKTGNCKLILLNEHFPLERLPELVSLFDESFTAIKINNLLDEFYSNPRIKENHFKEIFKLTDKEVKVLALLRKEAIKEVRVRMGEKGKGIVMVEVVEEKNINSVKEKIKAILDKEKVQNIRISNFEGNLLLFEETTKIKL